MKLTTYISAGVFIFLSAWVMKNKEANEQSGSLYHTKWTLKRIHSDSNNEVTGKAFILFNNEKNSAGGNGGCNSFGSTLTVTDNNLQISNIFSTKMFCEGIQPAEGTYFKYLGETNRFDIKGKTLSLYKDKQLLLEFSAE
jgi:heat shock protein HslJ